MTTKEEELRLTNRFLEGVETYQKVYDVVYSGAFYERYRPCGFFAVPIDTGVFVYAVAYTGLPATEDDQEGENRVLVEVVDARVRRVPSGDGLVAVKWLNDNRKKVGHFGLLPQEWHHQPSLEYGIDDEGKAVPELRW